MHLEGRVGINLVVLTVILLLDGEKCLVPEEDVFVPVLEETLCSCPSLSFKAGVRRCSFERRCALMCRWSLMRHDFIGYTCSALGT